MGRRAPPRGGGCCRSVLALHSSGISGSGPVGKNSAGLGTKVPTCTTSRTRLLLGAAVLAGVWLGPRL